MAEARERWGSRTGFILAAVGSAVGLGNIWRFPYVAWDNGGGAFIVPYVVALLTAGIPILILEYTIGHRHDGSAPLSFRRMARRTEGIGWWQTLVAFVISTYYSVVIAWAVAYTWFSVKGSWGDDPDAFFSGTFLGVTDAGTFGGFRPAVLIPLIAVWVITGGVLFKGVRGGIEKANRIFIPLLLVMFSLIVVRAVTLPGAGDGLEALFTPDWSRILDGSVWVAAYGQIFFSLSIAFAIMITYASYLPPKSDLTNNAFIAGFANASFELLAGIGVFAAVGFLAMSQGTAVDELATEGIGLAFVVFPQVIDELPALNGVFGVLFFGSLVVAGLSSLVSISQVYVAAAEDKLGWSRQRTTAAAMGVSLTVSLVYATAGGLNVLDVVDHFVNNYGIALAGLAEVIALAWLVRNLDGLRSHANAISDIPLTGWWRWSLKTITPLLLTAVLIDALVTEFSEPYGDYPTWFLNTFGWGAIVLILVAAVVLTRTGWRGADLTPGAGIRDPLTPDPTPTAESMTEDRHDTGELAGTRR